MAPKSRSSFGAGKGKGGRRQNVRPKSRGSVPLLPIVVAGILGILLVATIGAIVYYNRPAPPPPTVAGVPCDELEHTQVHYHAALQIVYHGVTTNLKGNTGIQTDSGGNPTCYYWLHVHTQDPNIIHIESPASQTFTLGQFFDVWSAWSTAKGGEAQKLDGTHVSTITLGPDDKMVIYIDLGDGKGATVYTGDPRAIPLKQHEVITIEVTPPDVNPPPKFTFPSGL